MRTYVYIAKSGCYGGVLCSDTKNHLLECFVNKTLLLTYQNQGFEPTILYSNIVLLVEKMYVSVQHSKSSSFVSLPN